MRWKNHAVVAALVWTAPSWAETSQWEQKRETAEQAARAERVRLGLDKSGANLNAYGTPEIHFDGAKVQGVCPGKTATVTVPGKFLPKTTFIIESDDVKVLSEKQTLSGWEARLQVKPNIGPRRIDVMVASPVSFVSSVEHVLDVACSYHWRVALEGGDVLTFATNFQPGKTSQSIPGEWTRAGKTTAVNLQATLSDASLRLARDIPAAEMQARSQAVQSTMTSPQMHDLQAQSQAAVQKMMACMQGTKDPTQQQQCSVAYQKDAQALTERQLALNSKMQGEGPAVGCDALRLSATLAGYEVQGTGCSKHKPDESVAGKVKVSTP